MSEGEQKNIEQWWHKYEAMGRLTPKTPDSLEAFFSCLNSVHRHWVNSERAAAQIEADIEHHISLQQVFARWRAVYGPGF